MKRLLILAGLTLLFVATASLVLAHAEPAQCTPAANSTVATAPAQVVCVMTEEIDTKQSTMSVWDASNAQVDGKDAHVDLNDPDHKTLIVSLNPNLPDGTYTVKWHTVTPDDNGVTEGSFQFTVGSAPAPATPTGTAPTSVPAGPSTPQPTQAAPPNLSTPQPTQAAPSTLPTTGTPGVTGWPVLLVGLVALLAGAWLWLKRVLA